jgi:hypothetical protein
MSCCPRVTAPLSERHRVQVRYGGGRSIVVEGPATGVGYRFSGTARVQLVDPRDAVAIVRNPLFRVDGLVEVPLGAPSIRELGDA